jgi:hypothetical protein
MSAVFVRALAEVRNAQVLRQPEQPAGALLLVLLGFAFEARGNTALMSVCTHP